MLFYSNQSLSQLNFCGRFQIQGLFSNLSLNLNLYNKLEKNTRLILIRSFTNPTSPQRNLRNKLLKENPYNFETLVSIGFNNHGKGRSRRNHTQNLLSLSLSLSPSLSLVFLVFMHTCAQ